MDHRPQAWGRPRDDVYGAYDGSYLNHGGPKNATQSPVVTGTSVIALKFKDGVVMAADNLASYGSLARFTDVKRLHTFHNTTILGYGGDVSDMQFLSRLILQIELHQDYELEQLPDIKAQRGQEVMQANNLFTFLKKQMYHCRNHFDPLWNQILIAGFDDERKPFLSSVDLRGTSFSAPSLATGFGAALAQPIMRKYADTEEQAAKLTREEAVEIVKECMKVLFYRDARSLDRYSIAVVTKDGIDLKENEQLEKQSWAFAERIKGYGTQTV
ncbi:nucleophile aminohydrolase [Podospora fimiseda]|uniref:Proteasome subunit beta n=1 Tax=Podospora fimiseda TaxID=252190 RepID=A0AAN7BZ94_9PEZI|nr:nucleophile aminohydrolase [Podospora fimiseda]